MEDLKCLSIHSGTFLLPIIHRNYTQSTENTPKLHSKKQQIIAKPLILSRIQSLKRG